VVNTSGKRERLLDWIRNGDPDDVPVMFLSGLDVAASLLGKERREVGWADAAAAVETAGTHGWACVKQPQPFDVIPFLDEVTLTERRESLDGGGGRTVRRLHTPEGDMSEVIERPKGLPSYHREFLVKGPADVKAFAYFIRRAAETAVRNPAVRKQMGGEIAGNKDAIGGRFPTDLHVLPSAMDLMSSLYMDQETAIFLIHDERDLMEELMDLHWQMSQVWLRLGAEHDVDICSYAVHGFEWLSPALYKRYMIPQARRINEFAASEGKLSWIHTCGKLRRIAEMSAYQEMKVDVVESLSMPPTGDIEDMATTRRDIGADIVTRGGINVELLYQDPESVRERVEYVLDSTKGFRHIMGDTNDSCPPYPWRNIQAVVDAVRDRGRLFT